MYETTSTFLQSELNYRADRLKSGVAQRKRRSRILVSRRAAQPTVTTR
jgi:hypothetical protein